MRLVTTQLKPHSLHSFWYVDMAFVECTGSQGLTGIRWHLGTCMPASILDADGYLCQNQQSLRRLSLITDGTYAHAGHRVEGVLGLTSLTSLSWRGVQHPREIEALRQCLRRNCAHLKALSIGFVSTNGAEHHSDILGLPWLDSELRPEPERTSNCFPSLSSLSLSQFTFPDIHILV